MEIKKGQIWEVKSGHDEYLPQFVTVESDPLNGLVRVNCDIIGMFDVMTLNVDDMTRRYDLIATPKKSIEKGQIWVTSAIRLAPKLEILGVGVEYRGEDDLICVKATFHGGDTGTRYIDEKGIHESYTLQDDKMEQHVKLKDLPTDQWNEIVSAWLDDPTNVEYRNFLGVFKPIPITVDSRLSREGVYRVKPKKLVGIPWHLIKDQYKFAFMDNDGSVFVSPSEPKESPVGGWVIANGFKNIGSILNIDTSGIKWQTSVTPRPAS